jgi:hypothetical protein
VFLLKSKIFYFKDILKKNIIDGDFPKWEKGV